MNPAIKTLMNEHRVIETVLGSLATFAKEGGLAGADARARVADYGRFFRDFADRVHHAKEEDRLFVVMTEHGFPGEAGPIGVMLAEHVAGRVHVAGLVEVGAGEGELSGPERARVALHVEEYVPLLVAHIQKEDNILYPMAERAVPPARMRALAEEFSALERSVGGEGCSGRYLALAAKLVEAYPPDPSRMAEAAGMGCGARR
jgi:hemerythrin-like domain-containing protein